MLERIHERELEKTMATAGCSRLPVHGNVTGIQARKYVALLFAVEQQWVFSESACTSKARARILGAADLRVQRQRWIGDMVGFSAPSQRAFASRY